MIQRIDEKYHIEIVTDLDHFEKLEETWDRLAQTCSSYLPFLCHDWFKLWIEHFLGRDRLFILLLHYRNDPVAIAPFLIKNETFKGIQVRKLELIGNVYSPIRNFIIFESAKAQKTAYLSYFFDYLFRNFNDWDVIDLNSIADKDDTLPILKDLMSVNNYAHVDQFCYTKYYMKDINLSGDEYLKSRSRGVRQELRRRTRKIEQLGSVQFKVIKNVHDIDRYIGYYYDVYKRSWKKGERIGPTFHKDLAKLVARKGWLRLGFLFLNDLPIAAQFRIVSNGVAYFLKTSYDQNYSSFGPGVILLSKMIPYLLDIDKVTEIDYGSGDESYKGNWASEKREIRRIIVFNKNLRGKYLGLLTTKILPFFERGPVLKKIKGFISINIYRIRK